MRLSKEGIAFAGIGFVYAQLLYLLSDKIPIILAAPYMFSIFLTPPALDKVLVFYLPGNMHLRLPVSHIIGSIVVSFLFFLFGEGLSVLRRRFQKT